MRDRLHRWPKMLAQVLLPSSCALCAALCESAVCRPCHAQYVQQAREGAACCPRCANPVDALDAGRECASCLARRPAFDATLAGVAYLAPLDRLVLQLKFGGKLALAPWFAQVLRDRVLEHRDFLLPNLLCPVPLGPERLTERGFNQALEIARPLARSLGIPLHARLAVRAVDTPAQSSVAPNQRGSNIEGAFSVAPEAMELVQGRHIGVVDDVMTSGHTLDELAATLKRYGAARVSNFVFARTPPH